MAVGTKGLQVIRVVVPTITVYVVYIKLRCVNWYKATRLTGVFFVDRIRILRLDYISFVYSITSVPTMQWMLRISKFHFGWATYRTYGSALSFVMLAKFVIHLYPQDRVRWSDFHS